MGCGVFWQPSGVTVKIETDAGPGIDDEDRVMPFDFAEVENPTSMLPEAVRLQRGWGAMRHPFLPFGLQLTAFGSPILP